MTVAIEEWEAETKASLAAKAGACRNFKKYKGRRRPTCRCLACWAWYMYRRPGKEKRIYDPTIT